MNCRVVAMSERPPRALAGKDVAHIASQRHTSRCKMSVPISTASEIRRAKGGSKCGAEEARSKNGLVSDSRIVIYIIWDLNLPKSRYRKPIIVKVTPVYIMQDVRHSRRSNLARGPMPEMTACRLDFSWEFPKSSQLGPLRFQEYSQVLRVAAILRSYEYTTLKAIYNPRLDMHSGLSWCREDFESRLLPSL